MKISLHDRLRGGVYGLLVGDALGVPYEFHHRFDLPPAIEMVPPPEFRRAHASVPPGTWSDDGAHALALLASLLWHDGRFDADDFARRLVNWYEHGYLAVDGLVFDVGGTTRRAIVAFRDGARAIDAGGTAEADNGNGSLMRTLPLALVHRGSDAELFETACLASRVTHGHLRSQVCCALYCLWARRLLAGEADAWAGAVAAFRSIASPSALAELELRPEHHAELVGDGYVVNSLQSARGLLARHARYEDVVVGAVNLGQDTDTTAAIAGGVAGVRDGVGAIPERWMSALRGRELVDPLVEQLLARSG